MVCKNICKNYKVIYKEFVHLRYADGQKRCSICDTFLIWDYNNKCPCCGHKLRIRPKNSRLRRQYNNILEQKQNSSEQRIQEYQKQLIDSIFIS